MANHDCVLSGCSGSSLFGISLTCQNCFKPVFIECIQTRNEVAELIQALGSFERKSTSSVSVQQQLAAKIENCIFASTSVFEFVCVKCKSLGNRFIGAIDKQNEHTAKLQGVSNELESAKKPLYDVSSRLKSETENANKLHVKLQQSHSQMQQANDNIVQLKFELEQQQILNRELQSKLSDTSQQQANGTGSSMDIEQTSSYNADIRDTLQNSIESMVARIENSMAAQLQNLIGDNGHKSKRKTPRVNSM